MLVRVFQEIDRKSTVELWRRCGLVVSWNDPHKDIDRKVSFQPELFFVAELGEQIVGTAMVGYDGHRGVINYMAVDPECQRRGIGRELIRFAVERLKQLGCPKINLSVRESNPEVIEFYRHLGFKRDAVISLGLRLEVDEPK